MYTRGMMRRYKAARDCCPLAREGLSLSARCVCSLCPVFLSHTKTLLRWGSLPALSESGWHPASVEIQIFLAVGSSLASAHPQLLLCLPYLFFLISCLTWCDQQLLEGLAVCLSSGVAHCHLSLISHFSPFCPLPIYHITFSLIPLSLLLSLRYCVLENNATT